MQFSISNKKRTSIRFDNAERTNEHKAIFKLSTFVLFSLSASRYRKLKEWKNSEQREREMMESGDSSNVYELISTVNVFSYFVKRVIYGLQN